MSNDKHQEHFIYFILLTLAIIPSTIEIDILAPSLPSIGQYFQVDAGAAQNVITLNFIGFILGALFYGPLSERLSIRNVLLIGLFGIIVSSIGCYVSSSLDMLLFFRIIQGLSSCAVFIMVLASFPQIFEGSKIMSFLGYLNATTALCIAVAPIIGNAINLILSWREIFIFIGMLAGISFILTFYFLRPTSLYHKKNKKLSFSVYRGFNHKTFVFPTCIVSLMSASHLIFISSSSFIYEVFFSFSNKNYILHYTCIILSFVIPSFLFNRISTLLKGVERTEKCGLYLCVISAISLLIHVDDPSLITLHQCLYCVGFSISSPIIFNRIMSAFPSQTGASSSMSVFIRNVISMVCLAVCSFTFAGNPAYLATEIAILNILIFCIWFIEKKHLSLNKKSKAFTLA